ncbi:MAG: hypothetical protein OSA99_20810 [Acidimicrobiales bacterium]|nr:hypothetical protein [Acidimicrobiales bacterium]
MIAHRRDHAVGISAEALALAWARRERAPDGGVLVIGQEISPRGFNGRLWTVEPERTVAMSIILRPELPADRGDVLWLVGGLGVVEACDSVGGSSTRTRWPDSVVDESDAEVAMVKVHVELGPAGVRYAIVTVRIDLPSAGLPMRARADTAIAVHDHVTGLAAMAESTAEEVHRRYGERSGMIGTRVRASLLPTGETRGIVQGFDSSGALVLGASADVHDRVAIDALRRLEVIDR